MNYATAAASGDFSAYTTWLIGLAEGVPPKTVMAQTPARLREATENVPPDRLSVPEAPGKWSVIEVAQHLADVEWSLGVRLRAVLATPGVTIFPIDPDAWARELRYRDVALHDALGEFEQLRKANLRFYERIPQENFERAGIHPERGEETAAKMLALYAGHDIYHLGQIERIKGAIQAL